jgi:hypothetical protein
MVVAMYGGVDAYAAVEMAYAVATSCSLLPQVRVIMYYCK